MISESMRIRIWGPYACFTRPEFHVERVSYPIVTPSAARGILEAILMKPIEKPESNKRKDKEGFRWHILRIGIVREGTMMPILRNELGYPSHNYVGFDINDMKNVRSQRHSLILRDVEYIIEAVIETRNNMGKYCGCIKRRAKKGQCYHRPYLGCREFPCDFEWAPDVEPDANINKSYGNIFHDFDFNPVWNYWQGEQRPNSWQNANRPKPFPSLNAIAIKGWINIEANGQKEVK